MGKGRTIIIVILLLGLVTGVFLLPIVWIEGAIMAYDGPTAQIQKVNHGYGDLAATDVTPSFASIDTPVLVTNLRCEVNSAPLVKSTEVIDTIERQDETDTDYINKDWQVSIVKCVMGVTITTTNSLDGLIAITDVSFTIRIEENSFSVFTNADESIAYILEVYSNTAPTVVGDMDITPKAQGYTFPVDPVGTEPVPSWITDSGYTGNLKNWRVVDFNLVVHSAIATITLMDLLQESYVNFEIGIDILLFGYWEQVSTKPDWELPDFWGDVLATIAIFMWYVAGIVITGLAIWRLKGKTLIIVLIGTWAIVLWMSGFLPSFLPGVSGG